VKSASTLIHDRVEGTGMGPFYVCPTILARANRKRTAQVRVDHPAKVPINAFVVICVVDGCIIANALKRTTGADNELSEMQYSVSSHPKRIGVDRGSPVASNARELRPIEWSGWEFWTDE
jgi:hypothetical protein